MKRKETKKQQEKIFEAPNYSLIYKMSWEKPIEQELLKFVRHMANEFDRASNYHRETGWFANNRYSEDLALMAKAYHTVEKYIEKEIEFRNRVKSKPI